MRKKNVQKGIISGRRGAEHETYKGNNANYPQEGDDTVALLKNRRTYGFELD
jgi:hypothetical protein